MIATGKETWLRPIAGVVLALVVSIAWAAPASAQLKVDGNADPVTVEADNGIEWVSDQKMYIARGNAKATRGAISVAGETLTALYRETDSNETEIYRLEALGGVIIASPERTAYGERAAQG